MPETKRPERGSFAATLASIRPGSDVDLADELRAVIAAVADTNKAGSVTFKIEVKPSPDSGGSMVIINDKITSTIPAHPRKGTLAFITEDGDLSQRDPASTPLFEDARELAPKPTPSEIKEL